MRLNKYIADCGIASRRAADKLIQQGSVKVNNKVVTELGTRIKIENDTVTVNGKKIVPSTRQIYIMLNKPKGCISTMKDDKGRKTIMDYIDLGDRRVFPIGRLDYDSEGLLLLTNDGEMAYKLTHPSLDIPKTYIVKVEGTIPEADLATLRKGVELDGSMTKNAKIKMLKMEENNLARYEITIYEGRNRQIHRMFEHINKEVKFLKRVAVGDVRLGGLARGTYRYLRESEIALLKKL